MQYKISDFNNKQIVPELSVKGVYKIETADGRLYIGSAARTIRKRWSCHIHSLKKNIHHCIYLQRIYNKHGIDFLSFSVLEVIEDVSNIIEREQYWIDTLKPELNILKTAGSVTGYRHTQKACDSVRKAQREIARQKDGIRYLTDPIRYEAQIKLPETSLSLGIFKTKEEALKARQEGVDYFWSEDFDSKSSEERLEIIENYKKDNNGYLKKGTNSGHNYIIITKAGTFRFDYGSSPNKHTKSCKTIEEAVQYRDEFLASDRTQKNPRIPPISGHRLIRQNRSGSWQFSHSATKYNKSFPTLEEAVAYKEQYLANLESNKGL